LSTTQDPFFARNKFSNFGDLGIAVNQMMQEYQRNAKINDTSNIKSIADMQSFMERYPAFRAQSINVSKHVAVLGELSRIVDKCHLLEISQLEQEIACSNERAQHKRELMEKIVSPGYQAPDKLRLAILYLIKYETYINDIKDIKSALTAPPNRFPAGDLRLLDAMIAYAGEDKRAQGLFSGGGLLSSITKGLQDLGKLEGAQNVYTQHQPLMSKFLEDFSKGKIKDATYPNISSSASGSKPSEVIIFVVGGATYEEATKVAEFNKQNPSLRVLLGGSCVLNSRNFLKEVMKNFAR
jgi:vacuolar protein sorting-associated protein 45